MKQLRFYYDVISPYAYLAFMRLPVALEGTSYSVDYVPLVFAGLLKHHGQLGPAEIAPKRDWTFRQVSWQARELGIPLQMPAAHPFSPIALLRLGLQASAIDGKHSDGTTNRQITSALFAHVWQSGAAADDIERNQALSKALELSDTLTSPEIKQRLIANGTEAIAQGVFGVPSIVVDDKLFWGLDSLPMLAAYLRDDPWFEGGSWDAAAHLAQGVARKR
jgi:2-hydroxychromene-2-carboxylate isomerase